jgi:hypothetical protein
MSSQRMNFHGDFVPPSMVWHYKQLNIIVDKLPDMMYRLIETESI